MFEIIKSQFHNTLNAIKTDSFRPLFRFILQLHCTIFRTNICENISTQYKVQGLEQTFFRLRVTSHNHYASVPIGLRSPILHYLFSVSWELFLLRGQLQMSILGEIIVD